MSGLASHPMGSWQPHGDDKSFMWIRDTLPHLVPNVKFILYGYDTTLAGSKSFQTVSDIALSFIHTLQQGGWSSTCQRELLFFAHSLGGIVLKEAFRMLADSGVMDELILTRTKGVIFFGVPSQGLDVSDLDIILKDQPNRDALVKEISNESPFIDILEEQFSGISHLQKMKLLWAYETKTTPTVTVRFHPILAYYRNSAWVLNDVDRWLAGNTRGLDLEKCSWLLSPQLANDIQLNHLRRYK